MHSSSMERKALGRIVGYSDKWRPKFPQKLGGNFVTNLPKSRVCGNLAFEGSASVDE